MIASALAGYRHAQGVLGLATAQHDRAASAMRAELLEVSALTARVLRAAGLGIAVRDAFEEVACEGNHLALRTFAKMGDAYSAAARSVAQELPGEDAEALLDQAFAERRHVEEANAATRERHAELDVLRGADTALWTLGHVFTGVIADTPSADLADLAIKQTLIDEDGPNAEPDPDMLASIGRDIHRLAAELIDALDGVMPDADAEPSLGWANGGDQSRIICAGCAGEPDLEEAWEGNDHADLDADGPPSLNDLPPS